MPLYIEHHKNLDGLTAQAFAKDHKKVLEVQDKHEVKALKYWFSEDEGEGYCLFKAPNKQAAEAVHREARGNLADEIVEVVELNREGVWGTVKQALIPNRTGQVWAIRIVAALMAVVLILLLVSSYYGLRTSTSAQDIAAILSAVAWPIIVLGVVLLFRTPLRSCLDRLAHSMRMKTVTISFFGIETEWSVEKAEAVLKGMSQEIVASMQDLGKEEYDLLLRIATENGERTTKTVKELIPNFKRSSDEHKNEEHERLRELRDRTLIRPSGKDGAWVGGSWQSDKYPILTKYGRLALSLYPEFKDTGHSPSPKA
jgi:hypothetical protein